MFAYVRFIRDGVFKIVDVRDIKDFEPKGTGDFDLAAVVRVLWRGMDNEIPQDEASRYGGQVLKLAGNCSQSLGFLILITLIGFFHRCFYWLLYELSRDLINAVM